MSGTGFAEPATDELKPVLDGSTRSFVRRALRAGLVEINDLKKVVVSLLAEDPHFTPERLAEGLVGAGILTKWQASKLLAGRSKGFYLGSYRLLRPIGKGGMGMVYLGEHQVMNRQMALKILPPEATNNARRLERFKEEARACAQLDHSNIVRAYDFAEAGGRFYIVMEFVDGIDLYHAVARDGVMSTAEVIDVLTQAAQGLEHAHSRGIVHRDIKPANLLLRTDGVLKVSDLGLARVGLTELDEGSDHCLMGTADFVAPEQAINSQIVDAGADIYSLGCTAFYLLSGRPPYEGETVRQRLARHQTAEIPDIRLFRKDCPEKLAELIRRMMAKRPSDRPRSTTELLVQLSRLGGGDHARPEGINRSVKPASDTDLDEQAYQVTFEDSSLSSDGEVNLGADMDSFDFGDLALAVPSAGSAPSLQVAAQFPAAADAKSPSMSNVTMSNVTGANSTETRQTLLLGVGLAVAFMALLAVLGIGIYSLSQPLPKTPPKIKASEDGKGGHIVVIQ